jgi:hypothetical protein
MSHYRCSHAQGHSARNQKNISKTNTYIEQRSTPIVAIVVVDGIMKNLEHFSQSVKNIAALFTAISRLHTLGK